jgi:acyl carrier protein
MDELHQTLVRCFQAVFPELEEAGIPAAHMESVPSWDSTASIVLLSVIGEESGIELDPAEAEKYTSFEQLLEAMRSHRR